MTTQPIADTEAKTFTVDQANAMLPLVRAIVSDIAHLSRDVFDRRDSLKHLLAGRQLEKGDVYSDELVEVQRGLEHDTERLRHYVGELQELGVECKGATEGLVDFPAVRDGRLVYLCWKFDEPSVSHWHEIDSNFAGRRPLAPDALVPGSKGISGSKAIHGSKGPMGSEAIGSDGAETMRR